MKDRLLGISSGDGVGEKSSISTKELSSKELSENSWLNVAVTNGFTGG